VPSDDPEGVSDIYITAAIDSIKVNKQTDTHYRAQKGVSSFNFRMIFDHTYPRADPNDYNMVIQLWDRDLLSSNDIIGEATINLKELIEDAYYTDKPVYMTKQYYDSYLNKEHAKKFAGLKIKYDGDKTTFWIDTKKKNAKGEIKETGKIRIQIDVFPKEQAEKNKVGEARQDPNHSPFLKPPEGRLELTMDPLKMARQLVGPELQRKIIRYLLCGACLALCVMLIPLIFGNIISTLIERFIF
jgi:otoferlin